MSILYHFSRCLYILCQQLETDPKGKRDDGYVKVVVEDYIETSEAERLVKLQNLIDDITVEQDKISTELAVLRGQGKEKTVQFRQLFTKKLSNVNIISALQSYGLME